MALAGLKVFHKESARLHSLLDEDPEEAIKQARALSSDTPVGGVLFTSLKAGILIDAGSYAKDKQAIEDGISLFKALLTTHPEEASYYYNLGNGLVALADQEPFTGYDWYLVTAGPRREARSYFQQAVTSEDAHHIQSVALTNLGNALGKAHRWVEAYDTYSKALAYDESNAVASTGAAKILLSCVERHIGEKAVLQSVAARHLQSAKRHAGRISELAGARAQRGLSKLVEGRRRSGRLPDLSAATEYEKFVAGHRLALSPTIEGFDCSLKRWDSLRFDSITEAVGKECGVPPIFAMFNVMKSDFLAARYLAFQCLTHKFPESGLYSDTLDYAVYGVLPSMFSLAQRACIDLLDKIAVATSEYFMIPGPANEVYFTKRWFANHRRDQPLAWHPSLRPHIDKGNLAVIALAELSLDIKEGGALHQKKAYRHSSTHRFTILHDVGCTPSRKSVHVEHCALGDFTSHLIESLQLARAAVFYFVEMISISEAKNKTGSNKALPLNVPTHHYIRGEDGPERHNRGRSRKGRARVK